MTARRRDNGKPDTSRPIPGREASALPKTNRPAETAAQISRRFVKRSNKPYERLTFEEEMAIVKAAQAGCEKATIRLLSMNERYIHAMARKMSRYLVSSADISDLAQEGAIGLMRAIPKFDASKGYRFLTYANWWINSSMYEWAFRNVRIVKFSMASEVRRVSTALPSAIAKLRIDLEDAPGHVDSLAAILKTTRENVLLASIYWQKDVASNTAGVRQEDGGAFEDSDWKSATSEDADAPCEEEKTVGNIDAKMRAALIREAISRLPERHRVIFENRILSENPMTLLAIGEKYDVSRERVRQLEKEAMRKFRPILRDLMEDRGLSTADLIGEFA